MKNKTTYFGELLFKSTFLKTEIKVLSDQAQEMKEEENNLITKVNFDFIANKLKEIETQSIELKQEIHKIFDYIQ